MLLGRTGAGLEKDCLRFYSLSELSFMAHFSRSTKKVHGHLTWLTVPWRAAPCATHVGPMEQPVGLTSLMGLRQD